MYTLRERDESVSQRSGPKPLRRERTSSSGKEAYRRAVLGVAEPVYQGGELVGTVQRYSDRLLEFLIRGRRPQTYRDNTRLEVTGANGGKTMVERG